MLLAAGVPVAALIRSLCLTPWGPDQNPIVSSAALVGGGVAVAGAGAGGIAVALASMEMCRLG